VFFIPPAADRFFGGMAVLMIYHVNGNFWNETKCETSSKQTISLDLSRPSSPGCQSQRIGSASRGVLYDITTNPPYMTRLKVFDLTKHEWKELCPPPFDQGHWCPKIQLPLKFIREAAMHFYEDAWEQHGQSPWFLFIPKGIKSCIGHSLEDPDLENVLENSGAYYTD